MPFTCKIMLLRIVVWTAKLRQVVRGSCTGGERRATEDLLPESHHPHYASPSQQKQPHGPHCCCHCRCPMESPSAPQKHWGNSRGSSPSTWMTQVGGLRVQSCCLWTLPELTSRWALSRAKVGLPGVGRGERRLITAATRLSSASWFIMFFY